MKSKENVKTVNDLITANNITVIRQGKEILNNVSLTIGEEGFITIIGPNGAGKSMLLKCLLGFYKPQKGEIIQRRNLKIGYVPQHLMLINTLPITVKRFLTLRKKTDQVSLEKTAIETKIDNIMHKQLTFLSGGEIQRVLLARSLLDNPSLLVLDEPVQNLDVSGQLHFYKLLDKVYNERKLSILMVSHDLHMVMASTKQVVCLYHHICCHGEPQVVTKDPEFISLFGQDMSKLMAVYQHSHTHTHN